MHTSSEEWISVSQYELNEVESTERRGIKLQFMISPADLPTAWRVAQVSDETLIVEFKYLSGNESKYIDSHDDGVTMLVGKNSRRIHSILLDLHKISATGEIMISRAVDALEHSHGLNKSNSEVMHKFLTSKRSKPELLVRMGGSPP